MFPKTQQIVFAILFCFILAFPNLNGQYVETTISSSCEGLSIGSILFEIDENSLDTSWNLPFIVQWENLETGEGNEFSINAYTFQIDSLDSGNYEITIDFSVFCEVVISETINELQNTIEIDVLSISNNCNNNGAVDIQVTGGSLPLSYNWSNGSNTEDLTNIVGGSYMITVTDINGCQNMESIEILNEIVLVPIISDVCSSGDDSGSIYLYNSPDLVYNWDSGDTTQHLTALTEGQYCVTATDPVTNCNISECFTVGIESSLSITNEILINSCLAEPTGSIDFNVEGGSGFTFIVWDDLNWWENGNVLPRVDLSPGDYTVTVYSNCDSYSQMFTIGYDCSCNDFVNPNAIIGNTCSSVDSSGFITILADDNYSYSWSNGVDGKYNSGLSNGIYTVTITDPVSGCFSYESYFVDIASPVQLFNITLEKSCSNIEIGAIDFDYYNSSGGLEVIFWDDLGFTHESFTTTRESLGVGEYCVNINNNCEQFRQCFEIEPYKINSLLEPQYGCDGDTDIDLTVTGDNPPFSFNWSNGFTNEDLVDLSFGSYYVTITDSLGCELIDSINLSLLSIINIDPACEGFWDGSITFEISNPNSDLISVLYSTLICDDCEQYPLISNDTSTLLQITLDDLSGTEDYLFYVYVGTCYFEFPFNVGEQPLENQFNSYDQDSFLCIYDKVCKDNTIIGGFSQLVQYDFENDSEPGNPGFWFGAFADCGDVEGYCGDSLVTVRELELLQLRNIELKILLNNLLLAGQISSQHYDLLLAEANKHDECSYHWFCLNNLNFINSMDDFLFWGGDFDGIESIGNDCFKVNCDIFWPFNDNYTICGVDFLPEWLSIFYDDEQYDFFECNPITQNLGQLIEYLPELENKYGQDFINSTLWSRLDEYKDDDRRYCAEISYCDDFSFLSTNIDEVECGLEGYYLVELCENPCATCDVLEDELGLLVFCISDEVNLDPNSPVKLQPIRIQTVWDDKFELLKSFNNNKYQIITKQKNNTNFVRLTKYINPYQTKSVKGIYNLDDHKVIQKYQPANWRIDSIPNIEFLVEDFNSGYHFTVVKESTSNTYKFLFGIFSEYVETSLFSNQYLKISSLIENNGLFNVKGFFKGTLGSTSNSNLKTTSLLSQFEIIVDSMMNIQSLNVLEGIDESYSIETKENKMIYSIPSSSGVIKFNGTNLPTYSTGEIVEIDQYGNSSSILSTTSQMHLVSYDENTINSNNKYYVLEGNGSIYLDTTEIHNDNNNNIVVLNIVNGSLNWKKTIDATWLNTESISFEIGENGESFIGFNLTNFLDLEGSLFLSSGGSDIIILGLDTLGNILTANQFGSKDGEILEEMYFSSGVLFLGGMITGETINRTIGSVHFTKLVIEQDHAFISFLGSDDLVEFNSVNYTSSQTRRETILKKDLVTVYPNPGHDFLTVKFDKNLINQNFNIEILNLNGQRILNKQELRDNNKFVEYTLDIGFLSPGLYVLRIVDQNNNSITKKFTKI